MHGLKLIKTPTFILLSRQMFEPIEWQPNELLDSDGSSEKWPVDDDTLSHVCARFIEEKLATYQDQRDIPSIKGTSGLSPYLALGIVSVQQLLALIQQRHPDVLRAAKVPFCQLTIDLA